MLDFKADIETNRARLDYLVDPDAAAKEEQLAAMSIACDAVMRLAERHADFTASMARAEKDGRRRDD